jgi:ABC-type Na+ efflux pump permease subunit
MSALRDIRLLIARHLDLAPNIKAGILDVMNLIDTSLDAEGYEAPEEVVSALRRLDHLIIFGEDFEEEIEENGMVDINDIFFEEEGDEEEEDED